MPRLKLKSKAGSDDVAIAIAGDGRTASVALPPPAADGMLELHDFRLAAALQYASAMAARTGSGIALIEEGDTVFFIEEPEPGLLLEPGE